MVLLVVELAPVLQLYVYGLLPPATAAVTDPVFPPLHKMFPDVESVTAPPPVLPMFTVAVVVQTLASVTVTV